MLDVVLGAVDIGDHVELQLLEMCLPPLNGMFGYNGMNDSDVCRLLFSATTVMAALHCWRSRTEHGGRHDPAMEIQV